MYKIRIIYIILCGLVAFVYGQVDFNSDVQPIFEVHCTSCHGFSGGLDLSSYSSLMSGSNNGAVIAPYDHVASVLWLRVNSGQMPPGNNDLSNIQIDLIAQWIDEGALEQAGSNSGCTDPEAYNCSDDNVWPNYIFDIGGVMYDNSCNWDWNLGNSEAEYIGGCESGPCDGYYNPEASTDDGSCRYYQSPHGDEVVFTVEENGISIDWSAFIPPITLNLPNVSGKYGFTNTALATASKKSAPTSS